jgi:hypothetical protein
MRNRADWKQLNQVMKKALTHVGAFLVNHKTVRFAQESVSEFLKNAVRNGQESLSVLGKNMHRGSA